MTGVDNGRHDDAHAIAEPRVGPEHIRPPSALLIRKSGAWGMPTGRLRMDQTLAELLPDLTNV
jgi:hypothetical protein